MALSCLLTRLTTAQSLHRGQSLRMAKNMLIRSSTMLSNKDSPQFLIGERTRSEAIFQKVKFTPLPSLISSRFCCKMVPEPEYKKHSHVRIWQLERILSAALLPAIPMALMMPSNALDTVVAIMIVMHTHWGLEAIVIDYIRPILFGELIPKIGLGILYVFSAAMLAGLLNLIYNDMGLSNAIRHLWKS